jgi:hypothetical protein
MIAVLQAAKAGKRVEFRSRKCQFLPPWEDSPCPSWDFDEFEYRVKPEPRTIWVNEVRNENPISTKVFRRVYDSHQEAASNAVSNCVRIAVKFVEVI